MKLALAPAKPTRNLVEVTERGERSFFGGQRRRSTANNLAVGRFQDYARRCVEVVVGIDEIVPVEHQPGGTVRLLQRSRILYLSAESDYVRIHCGGDRFLVRGALGEYERRWGAYGFLRTHRSFLVNMTRAVEIRPDHHGGATIAMEDGTLLPVARRHVADLRRQLALSPAPMPAQTQSLQSQSS